MLLPNTIRTAVRNRQFRQLAHLDFVAKQNSPDPWMNNGRFGVVFKMSDPRTGKRYALKVLKEGSTEKRDRLTAIAEAIKNYPSPYWIGYEYYPDDLTVAAAFGGGTEQADVLLMEWIEGDTLGSRFAQYCTAADRTALARLAYAFDMLALWLLHNPFAHGDLKQDNILVRPDGSLVLVDYDGIFLPAFAGQTAHELGTPDYQHPQRTEQHFNADIDDFSIIVISLALYAAAENPDRHATYNEGDNLLLCANDYDTLTESPLLADLKRTAFPAIQQRIALLDYALALPPQGLIGLPLTLTHLKYSLLTDSNFIQPKNLLQTKTTAPVIPEIKQAETNGFFKTDKQAQEWYDALPNNLRDAVQINLQLQANGKTAEEINKVKRWNHTIYTIKNKLLPENSVEIKINGRILNEMTCFYSLNDENLSDISSLSSLMNLQTLNLEWCTNLSDISPLCGLTNLQTLSLWSKNLSDISPLSGLTNLQTLSLWSENLSDISPLSGLTNLQTLDLTDDNLSNISPLRGLTNLQALRLCRSNLSDISPLRGLINLQKLDLTLCENLSDISPLRGLTSLQTLYLFKCYNLSNISPLSSLTNLQELDLSWCYNLSNISPLHGLTNLQILKLSSCGNLSDISLNDLPSLQELDLSNCKKLSDISPLSGLTNLQILDLAGCTNLSDISPLRGLTNLQTLSLNKCHKLSDISPLRGLTNLQTLNLGGFNDLIDFSVLRDLTNLQTLDLMRRYITQAQKNILYQLPKLKIKW
jgi:Leucine-rich repeat (LRR) protein